LIVVGRFGLGAFKGSLVKDWRISGESCHIVSSIPSGAFDLFDRSSISIRRYVSSERSIVFFSIDRRFGMFLLVCQGIDVYLLFRIKDVLD